MITEEQLLKWGFEKEPGLWRETYFIFALSLVSGSTIPAEYVDVDIERDEVTISYNRNYIHLANCTSKRKADQALRLLGLPSIDKLNTIKK